MKTDNKTKKARLFSLDFLKAISMIAVVSYHGILVPPETFASLENTINVIFAPLRFCVPVFLTLSFILLERSWDRKNNLGTFNLLKKRLERLAIPTIFWFVVAGTLIMIKESGSAQSIGETFMEITQLAIKGRIFPGAYYLWIMFQLLFVFVYIRGYFNKLSNVVIAVILQSAVFILIQFCLYDNLSHNNVVINLLNLVERSLFIYWFVYVALGVYFYKRWEYIQQKSLQTPLVIKILTIGITSLIMIAETKWLYSLTGEQLSPFEYALISCILMTVVLFFSLAHIEENQLPLGVTKIVTLLSTYSLGIFCINGIFHHIFVAFTGLVFQPVSFTLPQVLIIKLFGTIILLSVSLGLSILLDKIGLRACVR